MDLTCFSSFFFLFIIVHPSFQVKSKDTAGTFPLQKPRVESKHEEPLPSNGLLLHVLQVSHLFFMNYTEDEDYTIRWSLCCFPRSSPPYSAWIAAFGASVEQCASAGWHSLRALLFLGVAKRRLPGCSATVQLLHFCTCFQDNWHLKGRLRLLTVCPWPALCLHLKLFGPTCDWWRFLSYCSLCKLRGSTCCGGERQQLERSDGVTKL